MQYTIKNTGTAKFHNQRTTRQYDYVHSSAVPKNIPTEKETRNNINSPNARKNYLKALRRKYFKMALCGMISFFACYFFIGRLALISEKQNDLSAISNELREVQSMISVIEANIAEKLDVSTIEQRAMNELNMRMPLPHQIEEIMLDESDDNWD